jgi:hypothetical protein
MATAGAIPTTVRAAVVSAIAAARAAGRLEVWHEPDAAIAVRLAAALGRQKTSTADQVRLSAELRKVLDGLPLAPVTAKGVEDDGATPPAGSSGTRESRPPGLAAGVGPGPTVGDTALPT